MEQIKGECDVLKEREKARDKECEDLKAKCEAAMVVDFDNNSAVNFLYQKIKSLSDEIKEHKASLERMLLESKKWTSYHVSLLDLESKVASLEAEKAMLEAIEVLLRQEVENVKRDRAEAVSKVVPYVAMKIVCHAFEEVASVKEPFDLAKVKGYRASYKQQHTKADNDLATATFPFLSKVIADPHAPIEALLSKKPQVLQHPDPTRTHVLASSTHS
ncbi:hypothetical protein Tco_0954589 [Tanacetum coccineum]|uniref:FRIGIDA-like protein n=1 Tax=Tanacetum coccineum TaxID=301880 RepID=A0ABQ5E4T2_9ASTR